MLIFKIKAEFEWTFGYLLMIIDSSFSSEMVAHVITSRNNQFIDLVHELPLDEFQWLKIIFILPTYRPYICHFLPEKHKIKFKFTSWASYTPYCVL